MPIAAWAEAEAIVSLIHRFRGEPAVANENDHTRVLVCGGPVRSEP